MKNLYTALKSNLQATRKVSRIVEWGKLLVITGVGQTFIQVTGLISGLLIVRLLPIQEYALYTLANTMLGTMTLLADGGITNGVMAQSGKVWQNKEKLGSVLATGLNLRRRFGIISLIITMPILAYLLLSHGASILSVSLIIISIIPAFFAALSDSLLEIVPKLHQDIKSLQKNQAQVGFGRLVLSGLFLFIFPYTFLALFANGIPRIYGNYQLKKISSSFIVENEKSSFLVEKEVIKSVKRTMPIIIYSCVSSQISIWLVSFMGTTNNISEMGAVGRLSMIFNLFAVIFSQLIVPRFSRLEENKSLLLQQFLVILINIALIGCILLLLIWFFSYHILLVLGKNYIGLRHELLLFGVFSTINLIAGTCSQLVISRGWFLRPFFLIAVNLCLTVTSLVFFDMSSLINIIWFNIVVSIVNFFIVSIYCLLSIKKTSS